MKSLTVPALLFILATAASAQEPASQAFVLPEYETIPRAERYASRGEYEAARQDARFVLKKVGYASDGITVYAYLYAPRSPQGKLPVVVFNRGSWTWTEFAGEYLATFHNLARAGFVVLAPMYRGSGGAEGRDELGGADLNDLLGTRELLRQLPYADADAVFMYGESRGGMMTYQAIRERYPMRAAAVYGAFSDLAELARPGGKFEKAAHAIWPDYEERSGEIARRRSALQWAERFEMPVLIMHGGADGDVPPGQALALAARLDQLGKNYELLIRAGGRHTLSDWRTERDARAVEWFRRHMQSPAAGQP